MLIGAVRRHRPGGRRRRRPGHRRDRGGPRVLRRGRSRAGRGDLQLRQQPARPDGPGTAGSGTAVGCSACGSSSSTSRSSPRCNGAAVGVGVTMQLAHGRPHRGGVGALRLRLQPAGDRPGGVLELVPAPGRGHQPGAGVDILGPRLPRQRGVARRSRVRSFPRRTSCCRPPRRWPRRSPRTPLAVGDAHPPHDVAAAGRRPPDGGPQGRLEGHLCTRQVGRREGRCHRLSREAAGTLSDEGEHGHAVLLSRGGANVRSSDAAPGAVSCL